MSGIYVKKINQRFTERILGQRCFIQVLYGPRQVGKTTAIKQILERINFPSHYASADQLTIRGEAWLEEMWEIGRLRAKGNKSAILVIDEVQNVPNWPEVVKRLWDKAHLIMFL